MDVARDQLLAAAIGNVDWLRLCMKAADSYGFTALHMAAVHSRLACLKLLLEDCSVDVNVPNAYGWRALHLLMSQKSGHRVMPCLRYLLRRGADVNVRSSRLSTPLHRAASAGLDDCIALLVAAGADVHAENSEGHKPIDLCHLWCRRLSARYLHSAMWKKDKEDAVEELKKMEKIRGDIEELEEDVLIKMQQIPFGKFPGTKKLTEKLNRVSLEMETLPKSKPVPRCTDSSYRQRGKSGPSKEMKKETTRRESIQKAKNPKERAEQVSDGRKSASKKSFWNSSTNPQRPPTSYPTRSPTLCQGIYPRLPERTLLLKFCSLKTNKGNCKSRPHKVKSSLHQTCHMKSLRGASSPRGVLGTGSRVTKTSEPFMFLMYQESNNLQSRKSSLQKSLFT